MFYETLSEKAKEKYLELWDPIIGQVCYDNKRYDEVVMFSCDHEWQCGVVVKGGYIKYPKIKDMIPNASLELCIDMLEKMGYVVQSESYDHISYITKLEYYDSESMNLIEIQNTFTENNRLESLKKALRWALERECE